MKKQDVIAQLKSLKAELAEIKELLHDQTAMVLNKKAAARFLGMKERQLDEITRPGNMLIHTSKRGKDKFFLREDLIKYVMTYRTQELTAA